MKKPKIRIALLIIVLILCSYASYTYYSTRLIKHLACNQIFKPMEESFKDEIISDVNYMFFKWESERLDCDHIKTFEKRTLEFLNGNTVLIYTKFDQHEGWNYFFPLKYLFGTHEFIGKRYDIYSVKNDTIWRNIDSLAFAVDEYLFNKDSVLGVEQPQYNFIPYKEWATFEIEKQKLTLSYFRRE